MILYAFENPQTFMRDFGVTATSGAQTAQVILSDPGENIMGEKISSTQYEIEYISGQLTLIYGTVVVIRGQTFSVLDHNPVDDGVFGRARLQS